MTLTHSLTHSHTQAYQCQTLRPSLDARTYSSCGSGWNYTRMSYGHSSAECAAGALQPIKSNLWSECSFLYAIHSCIWKARSWMQTGTFGWWDSEPLLWCVIVDPVQFRSVRFVDGSVPSDLYRRYR